MHDEQISRTAQMTAFSRGYHSSNDSPVIFDDGLALELLGQDVRRSIEQQLLATLRAVNPDAAEAFSDDESALGWLMQMGAATSIVLGRAKYAEEQLELAVKDGVGQYVLLGAGLDTFAFRRPELLAKLRLFELDHPGTQVYKRQRLDELGWVLSDNLHMVPVDFTSSSLAEVLREAGFDPQIPAFFSWLGVTYYLTHAEVTDTLKDIARCAAPGSSVVFDYLDPASYDDRLASSRVRRMIEAVRQLGEPMQSGLDPVTLGEEMTQVGLTLVEDLSPLEIHSRYFMGRTDHYRACEHVHFARVQLPLP
jgi:methyltransferase (TIGR00027 family)